MNRNVAYVAILALCLLVFIGNAITEAGPLTNGITPPPTVTFTATPKPTPANTATPTATPTPHRAFAPVVMRECCPTPKATP